LKNFINTSLLETLTRNDVSLISNRILRVEKSYSRSLYYKRQLSSFFSTFRGVVLHSFSLETPRIFFLRFLELRADLLLLRAKLVKTLYHARWLIFSGFLFINRTLIRTLSFRLRRGDFLQVRKDNLVNTFFFNLLSFKLVRHDSFDIYFLEMKTKVFCILCCVFNTFDVGKALYLITNFW
jgi:ribosomal protein S4